MENIGIAVGLIFWPTVWFGWFLICRRYKIGKPANWIVALIVVGVPGVGACSLAWYMFVTEPLIFAASAGNVSEINRLLSFGADPNAESDYPTPLMYSAMNGRADIARILIAHGADVNRASWSDGQRRTPLSVAEQGKHDDMINLLRAAGAKE